jgi:hypothetical protein
VRGLEPSCNFDLVPEAIQTDCRGDVRIEHLERNQPLVLQIARGPDRGYPAASEFALEHVVMR